MSQSKRRLRRWCYNCVKGLLIDDVINHLRLIVAKKKELADIAHHAREGEK